MSRIVRFHQVGGPEVLQIDNIDVPPPAPGEVRIQVKALGLNRAEALFRQGKYHEVAVLPSRLGYEASGVVESLGAGVAGFEIGDAVSVIPTPNQGKYGVYGDIATVPAYNVVKNPTPLSFLEASAVWMEYMTAYGALMDVAKVQKDDYVLITAASSSVGLAAIELSLIAGAIPIAATRTSKKKKALEGAGAAYVIVTEEEDLGKKLLEITRGKGANIAFDPIGGKGVLQIAEGMAQGGTIVEYGTLSGEHTPFPIDAIVKGLTMRGFILFEVVTNPERFEKAKTFIFELLALGRLKPVLSKTFHLEKIVDAHRYLESNEQFGKITVTI